MTRKIRLIKGASYTSKGVHATKKNPEVTVDEAIAEKAVASGFFKFVDEPVTPAEPSPTAAEAEEPEIPEDAVVVDGYAIEDMTLAQLKDLASQMGISTKGLKNKASYIEAIEKASEPEPVVVSETMLRLQEE